MAIPGVYYEVKRGDVYYVRFDNGYGSEIAAGRPVVVVSDERLEKHFPLITCVYMTKTNRSQDGFGIELYTPRSKSWALCNQLYTYDKTRLSEYMCTLTDEEMQRIDAGLALNLGLNLHDPETDRRYAVEKADLIAKHEAEMAVLKATHEQELEKVRNEAVAKIVDFELCQRKYDYAMERLTTMIVGKDTMDRAKAVEETAPVVVIEEPAPVVIEEPVVEEESLVDINRCTLGDLCALGFPMATAKMIEAARPYMDVDDLRGVPGVTRIGYQLVEKRITVGDTAAFRKKPKAVKEEPVSEPVAEKVNVNTATAKEISEKAGINLTICYSIVGYRKKNGPYQSLDELTNVTNFGSRALKKYRDKMVV